jgi:hypothetical protein
MANKMTHTVRAELANAARRRYRSASVKEKRKILDEFIATTGYHEKISHSGTERPTCGSASTDPPKSPAL